MFNTAEKTVLIPLPARPVAARTRRLKRKVANDCYADIDTVRYSVPHRFVGEQVLVAVGDYVVEIYAGHDHIATHKRCQQPHQMMTDPAHFNGIMRIVPAQEDGISSYSDVESGASSMMEMGRSLDVYAQIIEGAGL